MTEKNLDAIEFIALEKMDGICGPNGCSIADHQKVSAEQKKQDNKN